MLEVFIDIQDLIYFEFIPEGRTVNKETRCSSWASSCCSLWQGQNWVIMTMHQHIGDRIPRKLQKTCTSTTIVFSRFCSSRILSISKDQIPTQLVTVCISRRGENSCDSSCAESDQKCAAGMLPEVVCTLAQVCHCPGAHFEGGGVFF